MSGAHSGEIDSDPARRPPVIEVVRVTEAIDESLATFFRRAWQDKSTAASMRHSRATAAATNPAAPGHAPPAVAYLRDGEVLGYLGTIPVKFWNGTIETPAYWLKGFMVLPEHRNGPVGFAVLRELLKELGLSGITTVALPARRLFTAVGYVDCGIAPNFISPLRPGRIARNLDITAIGLGLPAWLDRSARLAQRTGLAGVGGAMAGLGLGLWRSVRGGRHGLRVDVGGSLPSKDALDTLWSQARTTFAAAAVRDGTFLLWRYSPEPGGIYEAVSVFDDRRQSQLVAVAVVRRPREDADARLRGIKVATLSDLLFSADDTRAGLAALSGAERVARRMGADALLCTASHPAVQATLKRRTAVRLPGNVHLMIRDPGRSTGLPTQIESWWMTRGDASSDEAF